MASEQRSAKVHRGVAQVSRGLTSFWLVCLLLLTWVGMGGGQTAQARQAGSQSVDESGDVVALVTLPRQAQETYRLILAGGPFPYPRKDGSVFGNRERLLPRHPRGYYLEYTVPTPGSRNRGARRIVCGGKVPTTPEACYYTQDHYASFRRIVQ